MEDQEGHPQSWGARARMNKARAELEMARWAPELAGPGREMMGEARVDSHLLWTRQRAFGCGVPCGEGRGFRSHLLPGAEEQGGDCAGEEAHEMSQGLI